MPRKYVRKLGARRYRDFSDESLQLAIQLVRNGLSYQKASDRTGVPKRTIWNKAKYKHTGKHGGQTILNLEEERHFVDIVIASAEFGAPLTKCDLKNIVKNFLEREGRRVSIFKDGVIPGTDWCYSFIKRYSHLLSQRHCQNIKNVRAMKSEDEMRMYFQNLELSLNGIPESHVLNYDETNVSDDPGSKKCLFRRGMKYPERVMNYSKSSTSMMFAITGDGKLLPPYVVYKAERLYDLWCVGGPKDTKYNRTKSGWFDISCFQDWCDKIVLPWAKTLSGPKVLIGDNLSSHLNIEVLTICQRNGIRLVFLPAHSTHLTQPLDVGFFRTVKQAWRNILTKYKQNNPRQSTINKIEFPALLKKLFFQLEANKEKNIKNAFKATGIIPFDPQQVLKKLPAYRAEETGVSQRIDETPLDYLKNTRTPNRDEPIRKRKKMLRVEAGKSVCCEDFCPDEKNSVEERGSNEANNDCGNEQDTQESEEFEDISNVETMEEEVQVPKTNDYVMVNFPTKKSVKHFIGVVLSRDEDGLYEIKFMRRWKTHPSSFVFPTIEDISLVDSEDIVLLLENPMINKRGVHTWVTTNFTKYNL